MAKVLLVDDEELVRKVVRVVLEAEGHVVVEADGGDRAIEKLTGESPDVVVLDLMMPGEDGVAVCRRIRETGSAAKVLVLTSVPESEAQVEAAAAGADDFMVKPFSSLALIDRIAALAGA